MLLNSDFIDCPIVGKIHGCINDVNFAWALRQSGGTIAAASQADLESYVERAWERLKHLKKIDSSRVLAALNYFHVGCRLLLAGNTAFEFMAETILNFSKVLDVLFVSSGPHPREQVREGLKAMGYDNKEIERDFIPVLLLRNEFDIAHVALTLPNREQLNTLHRYTEKAEGAFRELIKRTLDAAASKTLNLPPVEDKERIDVKKSEILARLRQSLGVPDRKPNSDFNRIHSARQKTRQRDCGGCA